MGRMKRGGQKERGERKENSKHWKLNTDLGLKTTKNRHYDHK